jgi:hypothetical protein
VQQLGKIPKVGQGDGLATGQQGGQVAALLTMESSLKARNHPVPGELQSALDGGMKNITIDFHMRGHMDPWEGPLSRLSPLTKSNNGL